MTRLALATLGVVVALLCVLAGVYLVAGLGVALIVVGVLLGAACTFLLDVDRSGRTAR